MRSEAVMRPGPCSAHPVRSLPPDLAGIRAGKL